jgi:hypothetical protein
MSIRPLQQIGGHSEQREEKMEDETNRARIVGARNPHGGGSDQVDEPVNKHAMQMPG